MPANCLVAGLIGMPTMNFLAGRVKEGSFRWAGAALDLGREIPEGEAVLGIRPEDVVVDAGSPLLNEAVVDLAEHMGRETTVHFEVGGQTAVARLGPDLLAPPGNRLRLGDGPGKWHVFEPGEKGQRLA